MIALGRELDYLEVDVQCTEPDEEMLVLIRNMVAKDN